MSSIKNTNTPSKAEVQSVKRRKRNRRKKALNPCVDEIQFINIVAETESTTNVSHFNEGTTSDQPEYYGDYNCPDGSIVKMNTSTATNDSMESREKIKAAREAKKLAKQQIKTKKDTGLDVKQPGKSQTVVKNEDSSSNLPVEVTKQTNTKNQVNNIETKKENVSKDHKSKDEVDRAVVNKENIGSELDKDEIKAERAAKKAAKQAKKKSAASGDSPVPAPASVKADTEMTVRDVVQTLRDIKMVALEVKAVTAQVQALSLENREPNKKLPSKEQALGTQITDKGTPSTNESAIIATSKESEEGKSKAQLKAERRAKQEAQRAAKEAAAQAKTAAAKPKEQNTQPKEDAKKSIEKEKSPKPKTAVKQSSKQQSHRVSWFRHFYNDDKPNLDKLPVNSNLHPAIVKLGVQLSTRTVTGSNARCIALLHALKKMVRDFSLPARTEMARGLEAALGAALQFLWARRPPCASQTNAVKFFRHRLAQLPNNVDEFDAKKTLQEEIERYIREQIDMAGEAISITVRGKIREGDVILTYGCSSLIERILCEAAGAGCVFRAVVVGGAGAREMCRRLDARGVCTMAADLQALGFIMNTVDKVLLGASALLGNGAVLGAAGTAAVALAARARTVPVLVACETHKFSERVQTDAFVYNEIGDPDELIDKCDPHSPLRDWRSTTNLTPLNLTYDVTPPQLVTAVVTELAILPCTSAPVVLRFKLSEYSV